MKNRDLWAKLDSTLQKHRVKWVWVQGHAEDRWNNRADELAVEARKNMVASVIIDEEAVHLYPGVTWKNSTKIGSWAAILSYKGNYKVLGGAEVENYRQQALLVGGYTRDRGYEARNVCSCPHQVRLFAGWFGGMVGRLAQKWLRTREDRLVSNVVEWQDLCKKRERFDIRILLESEESLPACCRRRRRLHVSMHCRRVYLRQ